MDPVTGDKATPNENIQELLVECSKDMKDQSDAGVGVVSYTHDSVAMKRIVSSSQDCSRVKRNKTASKTVQRERPKVGVGVFVMSDSHPNCVLVGKRRSSSGEGKYGLPGGHQEFGESWVECGEREVEEETGLRLTSTRFSAVLNVVIPEENYHYIEFFVQGNVDSQHRAEPVNLEPNKCDGWEWVDWTTFLPLDSIFEPLKIIREQGFNPFL